MGWGTGLEEAAADAVDDGWWIVCAMSSTHTLNPTPPTPPQHSAAAAARRSVSSTAPLASVAEQQPGATGFVPPVRMHAPFPLHHRA